MPKAGLYVRVSTIEQSRKGYSIGEQIDRLRSYAEAYGLTVFKVYVDSHTGSNMDRTGLKEMIRDIESGFLDKVIVYKLDRLSRSQKDTLYLIEDVILKNGVDFVSMSENFDTATPLGRAMIGILAVFAQLEREQIKERMMMGHEARAKKGLFYGGRTAPFGYDYTEGHLVPNEAQAVILRDIFDRYASGESIYFIQKSYEGIDRLSTRGAYKYILRNRTYLGMVRYSGGWMQGTHEPIIDESVFEAVQRRLEESRERYFEQGLVLDNHSRGTYLGGLIYCGQCGARYTKRTHGTSKYGVVPVYKCYSRAKVNKAMIKDPNCRNRTYRCEELDKLIFGEISKLAVDRSYMEVLRPPADSASVKADALRKELKETEEQRSRFLDLYGLGRFSFAELDSRLIPIEERLDKLSAEISRLEEEAGRISQEEAFAVIDTWQEALERGNFVEIRAIIDSLVDRIVIDGDDISVYWRFN